MQQVADHIVGSRPILCGILAVIDEEIRALKWKLWHGQVERAICVLEKIVEDMNGRRGDFSATGLNSLGQQLLTYIRTLDVEPVVWIFDLVNIPFEDARDLTLDHGY